MNVRPSDIPVQPRVVLIGQQGPLCAALADELGACGAGSEHLGSVGDLAPGNVPDAVFVLLGADTGPQALQTLAKRARGAGIVAVGTDASGDWVARAMGAGATCCLPCPEGVIPLAGVRTALHQAIILARDIDTQRRAVRELNVAVEGLADRVENLTHELARLEVMAWTDSLTGLANRRQIERRLPRLFAESVRYRRDLTCLMIDLDGFKDVNDELGHAAGDDLLRTAARVIIENLRASDIAARYGGDEFIALMPETDAGTAQVVAKRLALAFKEAAQACIADLAGQQACFARCTMSIGIATVHHSGPQSADDLIEHADTALYAAKAAGKSTIMVREAAGGSVPA